MARFRLAPAAKQDLRDIRDHIAETGDAAAARRVLRTLKAAMKSLAEVPGKGHLREDLTDESVLFWSVYSYLIVYRSGTAWLEVARVLHGARDVKRVLDEDAT